MFTNSHHRRRGTRRGVVLILVLGMLGLMAMIGVMFASYSGQAEINARNYALSKSAPDAENVLDFALAQLINDTNNPQSALRGHSLTRDMYGNDASNNGYLAGARFTSTPTLMAAGTFAGLYQCVTDISTSASNSYDFTRWVLRFPAATVGGTYFVAQTFEVIADDYSGANHVLYVTPSDPLPTPTMTFVKSPEAPGVTQSQLIGLPSGVPFELDGRFLRAFNGSGMEDYALYGNFRVNGGPIAGNNTVLTTGDPNPVGMDEDYDACDLENWFLAIQSADGQVVIPSFHRPGILAAGDWTSTTAVSRSKILRPRGAVDNNSTLSFPDLIPDATTGKITYDVDNDGDGVKDAVWLDLGYPASRNAAGVLQKPLFAFTVIGLNGRLPLNTAGNLQKRADDGTPLLSHAAHLGNSPSEIDPTFALQNAPDTAFTNYWQRDNAGVDVRLTQLRNLLTGTRPQDNPYVLGTNNGDANALKVNGLDFYLPNNMAEAGETARNTFPVAGRWGEEESVPVIPAAAPAFNNPIRAGLSRFYDPSVPQGYGDARDDNHNTFDPWPLPGQGESPTGTAIPADYFDAAGALSRPVEWIRRFLTPIDVAGTGRVTTWDTTSDTGADAWGRVSFLNYFRPPGVPVATGNTPSETTVGRPGIASRSNNLYHGYEAFRDPKVATLNRIQAAAMPFNLNSGASFPTYDQQINSAPATLSTALDEADEMNLYAANDRDAPFGPTDLQWLYRLQDVDGASLNSRLAKLAPVSFLNPYDGIRRRRLFSTDTWETTNFVWANDNPRNAFPGNSRFVQYANASFANLKVTAATPFPFKNPLFNNAALATPTNVIPANDTVVGPPARTPQLAHRDRKINLNYPLPVSNDPDEVIRQKWIRDTYQMLKAILPPLATDTPEELAQLSQFVVNIIDFRDPDATMTRFINPDLMRRPVAGTAGPPPAYDPPIAVFTVNTAAGDLPFEQFGMEYNPIALNEVLAYSFTYRDDSTTPATPKQANRMYVELVNTLTEAGAEATASDINLTGWEMVILPDDPRGRPEPLTGRIPALGTGIPASPTPVAVAGTVPALKGPTATADATGFYYVLGNNPPVSTPPSEVNSPTLTATLDPALILQLPVATPNTGPPPVPLPDPPPTTPAYLWLYLLRPSNPFDTASPKVVVDSLRFPFSEGGGMGNTDAMNQDTVTVGTVPLYSVQRLQPYRGGHAVPPAPGNTPFVPADAYGYSDQTSHPTVGGTNVVETVGMYGDSSTQATTGDGKITLPIYNTIGAKNDPSEKWDYLPFHDRDFTSVAELMMVPGCPPGLFTKKFAELAPPIPVVAANPSPPMTAPSPLTPFDPAVPHPFPYLVDNFFYTAASAEFTPPTPTTPQPTGGLTSAGWFKMFEFLEVPSPAAGAVGTVAQGNNYDWYRQDVKPGLLNLNLIIDEEVFLGLMSDARLNMAQLTNAAVPKVVTLVDATGAPSASYAMNNLGFLANFPYDATNPYGGTVGSGMKAAFGDFLKLRHGGSGFLFGFGNGAVGTANARERPFRSLSFPDINETVMCPASLPPSTASTPAATTTPLLATQPPSFVWDPGVKNPYLYAQTPVQPPPIPARRLIQIPDNHGSQSGFTPPPPPSNASTTGDPAVNTQTTNANLTNPRADLTADPVTNPAVTSPYLGSVATTDHRQHPYFRTEWLQKAMNLTTVRTHQYAVWITVGFFEVRKQGNPQLAATDPDQLGLEVGARAGKNVRYRSFFILDRTRAHGFNPSAPGDFREVITYRQRIQ